MKRLVVVALAIVSLSALSCKKLKSLADVKFSVPYSQSVDVPGLPGNPPVPPATGLRASIPTIPVATMSEENIKKYNTSSELIKSVVFTQLKLEVTKPDFQTLDMVDSLWLYVSAAGLPEMLASHAYNIPKGIRVLDLQTNDANIKEYFLKDTMFFRVEGHFNAAPDSASVFIFSSAFDVVANPLGE